MDDLFAKGPQNAIRILKEEQDTGRGKRNLKNLLSVILNPENVFNEDTNDYVMIDGKMIQGSI